MNILLTGGVRSGKSDYAEKLAKELGGNVLFVATAIAFDDEMKERIKNHKASRPKNWRTIETPREVGEAIRGGISDAGVVIIDCITVLINNLLLDMMGKVPEKALSKILLDSTVKEVEGIINCMKNTQASYIMVTNEVGMGIVPENKLARIYRDALGKANQLLAEYSDNVLLMVCGLPVKIKPTK